MNDQAPVEWNTFTPSTLCRSLRTLNALQFCLRSGPDTALWRTDAAQWRHGRKLRHKHTIRHATQKKSDTDKKCTYSISETRLVRLQPESCGLHPREKRPAHRGERRREETRRGGDEARWWDKERRWDEEEETKERRRQGEEMRRDDPRRWGEERMSHILT